MSSLDQPLKIPSGIQAKPSAALTPAHLHLLLLGLGFATGMEFYTGDSVNLVLTDLTGSFGVSGDEASWSLTIYSSTLFLGVPVCVWLAGYIGHRIYLIASIVAFVVASIVSATAVNFDTMLVARACQGLAGSGLVVWWRGSVYLLLPKPQRSASLMRVSTMLYLSSATGMLFSGYITDAVSWRLICIPNIAFAAAAIVLLLRYYPEIPRPPREGPTDWPGVLLIGVALVSLQIILSRGAIDDWFGSPRIVGLAYLAGGATASFILWQTSPRNRQPLLRLALMRDRYVLSSILMGVFTGIILSGSLYLAPEFLRNVSSQPLSATQTGRVMCLYALTAAAVRPIIVPIVARFGQRKTIAGALICLIASMLLFWRFMTADTPSYYFYPPLILYGLCVSGLLPAVGSGTVARVDQSKLLDGVALYMTFRQFGAALGVALLTIFVEDRESLHSSRLFEHLRNSGQIVHDWTRGVALLATSRSGQPSALGGQIATKLLAEAGGRQAATLAYADAFLLMAGIGVITLCLTLVIPPTPVAKKT